MRAHQNSSGGKDAGVGEAGQRGAGTTIDGWKSGAAQDTDAATQRARGGDPVESLSVAGVAGRIADGAKVLVALVASSVVELAVQVGVAALGALGHCAWRADGQRPQRFGGLFDVGQQRDQGGFVTEEQGRHDITLYTDQYRG